MRRSLCSQWANPLVSTGPSMARHYFRAGHTILNLDVHGSISALMFDRAHFHPLRCSQRAVHSCTGIVSCGGVACALTRPLVPPILTHFTNRREEHGYCQKASRMCPASAISSSAVVQKRSRSSGSLIKRKLTFDPEFEKIRSDNTKTLYVDKTQFIYSLINDEERSHFLFRPRRFGKTLFLNTLKCFFEGKKELFEGLKIAELMGDAEWEEYPVLKFTIPEVESAKVLRNELIEQIEGYAKLYKLPRDDWSKSIIGMMKKLLIHIHATTKKPAVVLIDEFNHPQAEKLLIKTQTGPKDAFEKIVEVVEGCNTVLSQFLSFLKETECPKHFVFLTGVTSYAAAGTSAALNNSHNITFQKEYSTVCGFTEAEIDAYFTDHIKAMKVVVSPDASDADFRKTLREWYNGYHFSSDVSPEAGVYNPYSFVRMLKMKELTSYWVNVGETIPLLSAISSAPTNFFNATMHSILANEFVQMLPTKMGALSYHQIISILFQRGFFTVCTWDAAHNVGFKFPNKEIRDHCFQQLLTLNTSLKKCVNENAGHFISALEKNDILGLIRSINAIFSYLTEPSLCDMFGKNYVPKKQNVPQECMFSEWMQAFCVHVKTYYEKTFSFFCEYKVGPTRADFIFEYNQCGFIVELKTDRENDALKKGKEQIKKRNYGREKLDYKRKHYMVFVFSQEERVICEAVTWEEGGEEVIFDETQCTGHKRLEGTLKERKRVILKKRKKKMNTKNREKLSIKPYTALKS